MTVDFAARQRERGRDRERQRERQRERWCETESRSDGRTCGLGVDKAAELVFFWFVDLVGWGWSDWHEQGDAPLGWLGRVQRRFLRHGGGGRRERSWSMRGESSWVTEEGGDDF
jgi:hypothetical protein